ncbi:MAG: biotin carboxyl carrier protein [Chitinophagaceae bacterium]|jgi:biotin carboxyl carrier protein|nr:biotin carboxyl carrier protein [Chitinophagaceae bacterium]
MGTTFAGDPSTLTGDGLYSYKRTIMPKGETPVFKVKTGAFEFDIDQATAEAADVVQLSPGTFHIVHKNRSVSARVIESDATGKKQVVEVDGEVFTVEIKDELDQLLDKMGFSAVAGKQLKEIKAPMPGLVLQVNVTEGQQVKQGEKLLILVAMKMENSIMIQADATIKRVAVTAGQAVEKGQVLVELE